MEAKANKRKYPHFKLKKSVLDYIIEDVAGGATIKTACLSNGVSVTIFDIWRRQGEIDLTQGIKSLYTYLVIKFSTVQKKEQIKCKGLILSSEKGHKGAEWVMEHYYWQHFGNNLHAMELAEKIDDFMSKSNIKVDNDDDKDEI